MIVRKIRAEEVLGLRQMVLIPPGAPEAKLHEWDLAASTAHFGAFARDELIGVASFVQQSRSDDGSEWRLRGMATLEEHRGLGAGRLLIEAGVEYVRGCQGRVVWCHARESAFGFYSKLGFKAAGERFDKTWTGPHFIMERNL